MCMRWVRWIGGLVGVLLAVSSVFALPAVVDESDTFSDQEEAPATLSLEQQVHRLEQQLASYRQMRLPERIDDLSTAMQKLQGQLEEQSHALHKLQAQQEPSVSQKSSHPVASVEPVSTETDDTEKDAYQAAFRRLRAKKYTQAVDDLQRFVQRYPESVYTANAYYWLGEIYFLWGQFSKADASFQTVVTQYPASHKMPDALLKRALILKIRDKQPEARRAFEYIVRHFPGTPAARLAALRLRA